MAQIVGYIASSLDGFIATERNTLEWLTKYDVKTPEFAYARFIAPIRTVVMGRGTWDYLERENHKDIYRGKRTIIVTSRPIIDSPDYIEIWSGSIDELVAELRGLDDGPVWMCGGGKLQMAFMQRGALDEIEIYLMPELIGGGYPLFPPAGLVKTVELISATALPRGCVRLHYRLS